MPFDRGGVLLSDNVRFYPSSYILRLHKLLVTFIGFTHDFHDNTNSS
jgi:hypothetical protein